MNILPDLFALQTLLSLWLFLSLSFEVSGRYSARGVHKENNPEGVQRPQPQIHPQQLLLILDGLNLRCVGVLSHFELPVPPSAHCLNSSFISSTKSEALGPAGEVSHFFFQHDLYISFQCTSLSCSDSVQDFTLYLLSLFSCVTKNKVSPLKVFITSTTSCGASSCG